MTKQEVSIRYGITDAILDEYQMIQTRDGLRGRREAGTYTDLDLDRLSLLMALTEMGLSKEDRYAYMRLVDQGRVTERDRLKILDKQRCKILDEIHRKEKQLERMDYLRYEIQKNQRNLTLKKN